MQRDEAGTHSGLLFVHIRPGSVKNKMNKNGSSDSQDNTERTKAGGRVLQRHTAADVQRVFNSNIIL